MDNEIRDIFERGLQQQRLKCLFGQKDSPELPEPECEHESV